MPPAATQRPFLCPIRSFHRRWWTRLGEEDLEGVLGLGAQRRDAHLDRSLRVGVTLGVVRLAPCSFSCVIDGSRKERWLVRERSCKSHDS